MSKTSKKKPEKNNNPSIPQAPQAFFPPPLPPESHPPGTQPRGDYGRLMETMERLTGDRQEMALASPKRSKYEYPNVPTPCDEGQLRGCKTACCTLYFELSQEDLDQGFEYEPNMPYAIRHGEDGYCYLLDRKTWQCSVWEDRPKTCRIFDCRCKSNFKHLWED